MAKLAQILPTLFDFDKVRVVIEKSFASFPSHSVTLVFKKNIFHVRKEYPVTLFIIFLFIVYPRYTKINHRASTRLR